MKTGAQRQRELRQRRKIASRCKRCNLPCTNERSTCSDCLQQLTIERAEKKDAGFCIYEGCWNVARIGKSQCERCARQIADRGRNVKQIVLDHYGQRCNCSTCLGGCHVTNFKHLTIDHKNNDGAKHRREDSVGLGSKFYRWIVNNAFPDYLQVLCHNCNSAKNAFGGCE